MSLWVSKARVGSPIHIWQKHMCYQFPEIYLWCYTCRSVGSQSYCNFKKLKYGYIPITVWSGARVLEVGFIVCGESDEESAMQNIKVKLRVFSLEAMNQGKLSQLLL